MLQSAVSLSTPMLYVSPIVEALRGRPRLVFWFATLTQALLWVLVPSLFYAAPPGNVPLVLAVGHEWQLGSVYGPPLAYWFADLAYRIAGGSVVGVYILAQACIVVTFWAVFALAAMIVGLSHAALAVLLMAGISVFAASTPDFGPAVLAAPFTALALLFYWRAHEGHERSWFWLGVTLGLLVLTTYFGVLLLLLLAGFTAATERGRSAALTMFPYIGLAIVLAIALPHVVWLLRSALFAAGDAGNVPSVILWIKQIVSLVSQHAGLLVMIIVGGALAVERGAQVPELVRGPVDPVAKLYVFVFALAPAVLATLIAAIRHQIDPLGGEAAPVVLTALAVIVLAGNVIRLYRQMTVGWTWFALLVGPPLLAAVTILVLPWTVAIELKVNEPAAAMGRFFTESFNRRTNKPLEIVVGDARLGGLVAMASSQRPRLLIDGSYERAPWVTEADIRQKGAIVVWGLTDAAGTPPAHLRERFPDLVPEVPRTFERAVQGRLSAMRIGWAMIRPESAAPPQAAPVQ